MTFYCHPKGQQYLAEMVSHSSGKCVLLLITASCYIFLSYINCCDFNKNTRLDSYWWEVDASCILSLYFYSNTFLTSLLYISKSKFSEKSHMLEHIYDMIDQYPCSRHFSRPFNSALNKSNFIWALDFTDRVDLRHKKSDVFCYALFQKNILSIVRQ